MTPTTEGQLQLPPCQELLRMAVVHVVDQIVALVPCRRLWDSLQGTAGWRAGGGCQDLPQCGRRAAAEGHHARGCHPLELQVSTSCLHGMLGMSGWASLSRPAGDLIYNTDFALSAGSTFTILKGAS